MATQPQKNNLVKLLEDTITSNKETIEDNKLTIIETQKIIDDFSPSCKGFDNQIVSLVTQINTLKSEIVSLYSQALAVGCGTMTGATTIYPDTILDNYYNLSSSTYEDDQPYVIASQTLTSSNVGFGTFVTYKKNDSGVTGLGISYADVGLCYGLGCVSGNCTNYANQITIKQNQIIVLQSQVGPLVPSVNLLKTERVNYQTRRWSDLHTNKELGIENQNLREAIRILNDPVNDAYI